MKGQLSRKDCLTIIKGFIADIVPLFNIITANYSIRKTFFSSASENLPVYVLIPPVYEWTVLAVELTKCRNE